MEISDLWPRLGDDTRDWLVAHNGESLTDEVLAELLAADDGSDAGWLAGERELSDASVDWIEATANDE